jgi:polyisoprenoid-binding protein YceI
MARMRKLLLLLLVAGTVGLFSCQPSNRPVVPHDGPKHDGPAPQAQADQAGPPLGVQTAAQTAAPALAAGAFRLAPDNTKIEFVGSAGSKSQPGRFRQFHGVLDWPDGSPGPTRLSVEIDMESVETNIFLLTKHLRSADFFDVAAHPKASFTTTKIEPGQAPGSYALTGDFTLHGVTKSLSVPATCGLTDKGLTLDCKFTVRQSEFGMVKAAKKTNDEVPVTVSARLSRG